MLHSKVTNISEGVESKGVSIRKLECISFI